MKGESLDGVGYTYALRCPLYQHLFADPTQALSRRFRYRKQ